MAELPKRINERFHQRARLWRLPCGQLQALTRYMAVELAPRRIVANVVAPGAIATDFSGGIVRDNPQVNKAVADHTALGRAGVAEDVGPVIAALLSDDFGRVNAQRIEVSGGVHIQEPECQKHS
jgi:NAD(P)-dependent dehydrogenase (short-subunit alcohol dehydrogenase family)